MLPWERVLWRGRPVWGRGEEYLLTDFRLMRRARHELQELVLHDIADVSCRESRLDRAIGTSTLIVSPRRPHGKPLVLRRVRRGQQLAALLELLASEPMATIDSRAIEAALTWDPQQPFAAWREGVAAAALAAMAVFAIVAALHGKGVQPPATYGPDDPIAPGGHKRARAEIARYMQEQVMPWARTALGPVVGGADRVRCETCHGSNPEARNWRMPAVAALPKPDLRELGWEVYGGALDAQMRNAIYGYVAEPEKQERAAYMREVVLPGMARLLHRPPYDFTQPYAFNRSRLAFGCYHCHLIQ